MEFGDRDDLVLLFDVLGEQSAVIKEVVRIKGALRLQLAVQYDVSQLLYLQAVTHDANNVVNVFDFHTLSDGLEDKSQHLCVYDYCQVLLS